MNKPIWMMKALMPGPPWPEGAKGCVANVQCAFRRECRAVAAAARGRHAVEQIDAALDCRHEIGRKSDAHKITGECGRQPLLQDLHGCVHLVLRLPDGESTDGDARPRT